MTCTEKPSRLNLNNGFGVGDIFRISEDFQENGDGTYQLKSRLHWQETRKKQGKGKEKEEEEVGGRGPSGDSRPFPTGFGEAQFPRH